jgi:hypothetical protein
MLTENIIHILSIVLPFSNETAIILTESKILKRFYVSTCDHPTTLEMTRKIAIDIVAYLGIMLFIGKNTLLYGYFTGIVTGLVMIFTSIILPDLFLETSIAVLARHLRWKTSYGIIIIGLSLIAALMVLTNYLEAKIQPLTKNIKIDPTNEKK